MSLISSVTSAAATLAAGIDPGATTVNRTPQRIAGATATATGKTKAAAGAKATATAKKTTTPARSSTTAKSSAATTSAVATTGTASSGYAKAAGDDFAFLKDAALSVEEKLFRFMCAVAQRNDDQVLKKMEEMKGGSAASGGASTSGAARKPAATSVWSALKALVPPLGLAAQLVGDAKLKSLITQVSGPVLAAAATALGMPALAPLALQAGPGLASAIVNGKVGGEAAAVLDGSPTSTAASGTSASTTASGKNEQVQLMELQRLVDKQKEMFAMISNVLRAQHDTRMAIIGNVR
jgi:hypothetical protein